MSSGSLLSYIVWLPMIGAALLYLVPAFGGADSHGNRARIFSTIWTLAIFALSFLLVRRFEPGNTGMQFVENIPWIPQFGITYKLGLDGISLWLVMLTTLLMPIICLASFSIHSKVRGYLANMLVLQTAMLGTLVALDLFLFYVFWELMLAPMYFIIGLWGGTRRIYATIKFILYTMLGSVLMFLAIFYVVWRCHEQTGMPVTFDLDFLIAHSTFSIKEELWLFAAFALAFGIKVPIFPFHTWLPDAHVEAPTGGSVVLAGVLLKMGLYGFIRFAYPLFPRGAAEFAPYLALLGVIGVVYGALVAWAQTDMKKLVAYSSVSHLGYCVLGWVAFNTVSASGSIMQMLNHGITTGGLFLLVGVLYDRRHTHVIAEFGGLANKLPIFAALFLVFTFSSIALPLTNGFIGEFMILTGSFRSFPGLTIIACTGVILGAVYMLTLYQRTCYGEIDQAKNGSLLDLSRREITLFVPLLFLVFAMGIYPQPFLDRIEPTLNAYFAQNEERATRLEENESSDDSSAPDTATGSIVPASVHTQKENFGGSVR